MQITKRIPPKLKDVADSIRSQLANEELMKLDAMPDKIDIATDWITGIIDRSIEGSFTNYDAIRVGQYKFYQCYGLTDVTLYNCGPVGTNAFNQCTGLITVNLPKGTRLDVGAFLNCSSLTMLNFYDPERTSIPSLPNAGALTNTPIANGEGYVVINDELVAEMKETGNWSTYADQIIGNTQAALIWQSAESTPVPPPVPVQTIPLDRLDIDDINIDRDLDLDHDLDIENNERI